MFKIKNIVWKLFQNSADNEFDTPKVGGSGIIQRFLELNAEELDDNFYPLVMGLLENTRISSTVHEKYIPYLENELGNPVIISKDLAVRRKILKLALRIYQVKGTKLSYEILFKLLGFDSVTITEQFGLRGFDSPITFDDDIRRLDSGCYICSPYQIDLTGSIQIDSLIFDSIERIIEFVEPINADLTDITYNGNPVLRLVTTLINENGDLIADVTNLPAGFTIEIVNGELIISGPNQDNYRIINNNLFYVY